MQSPFGQQVKNAVSDLIGGIPMILSGTRHKYVMPFLAMSILLILLLSGCSISPAKTAPPVPPPGSMIKAKPLPLLPALPEQVSVTTLIENDLKVVEQYHDLAIRHDTLVDWVWEVINEYNRRIEAGE